MLEIYLKEIKHQKFNDVYFDRYMRQIDFNSNNIKNIIKAIDDVEYIGDCRVKSKFESNIAISVRELSTGCKTAINVISFPQEIFTVVECGDNALQVIFNYRRGKIFMPMFSIPREFKNEIKVYTIHGEQIINNNKQLEEVLNTVF